MAKEEDNIVISGISGRYPNSENVDEFWENLISGTDMITDEPRRWPTGMYGLPARAGLLKSINNFDATFFSVSAKQADKMDAQLRILLEVCYEAIIDSGYHPHELRGKKIGVYVGASSSETYDALTIDAETQTGYGLLGCCRNMYANRISYTFDFKGPSYTLDTACSSSLFAIDAGVKAIQTGDCDMIIAAGVNLLLKPNVSVDFNRLSMLSADGACKVFDERANGYVRAETVSAVLISRQDLARRAYAKILGCGTNTDGYKSSGITYPSYIAQSDLLFDVYRKAGVSPRDVYYVEMHGTGTQAGDLQEMLGVERFFLAEGTERSAPLLVGSVKSNMGHSEPGSGIAALTKLLLSYYYRKIPANLNFEKPNPKLTPIVDGRVQPVVKHVELEPSFIVGLNSFGFGGANAHIILQGIENADNAMLVSSEIPILLPQFGRLEDQVKSTLLTLRDNQMTQNKLSHVHLTCQGAASDNSRRGFVILNGVKREPIVSETFTELKRPLWFVITGMGAQWRTMGKDMMKYESFRNSMDSCTKALQTVPSCDIDVRLLVSDPEADLETPEKTFVALCAMQIGLIDLLHKFGIKPDGIVGHSVGELVCGYVDGCLDIRQTILAAYFRGKCIRDADLSPGGMAAVGLTWEEATRLCQEHGCGVVPACHNSEESVTISGDKEAVENLVDSLKSKSVFAKMVNSCGVAFHSPALADIGPQLSNCLKPVIPQPKKRSSGWICTSRKETDWYKAEYCDAEYLSNNLVSPVRFFNSLRHIDENAIVVEIAACGLLQGILKQALPKCTVLPVMKRNDPKSVEFFLSSIGRLWNLGVNPRFGEFYRQLKHPMVGLPPMAGIVSWDHSIQYNTPSYLDYLSGSGGGTSQASYSYKVDTSDDTNTYHTMAGHVIDGRNLLPATGYLFFVWKSVAQLYHTTIEKQKIELKNVKLHQATILSKTDPSVLAVTLSPGKHSFEVCSGETLVVSGEFSPDTGTLPEVGAVETHGLDLDTDSVYKEFRLRGYEYEGIYQGILSVDTSGTHGTLKWVDDWVSFLDTMLQVQLVRFSQRGLRLPTRIRKIVIDPTLELTGDSAEFRFNPFTNQCTSRGVLIEGLHTTMAQRRTDHKSVKFEKHIFVPYVSSGTVESPSTALRNLLDICQDNIFPVNTSLSVCELEMDAFRDTCTGVLDSNPGRPPCQYVTAHKAKTESEGTITWDSEKETSSTVFDIVLVSSEISAVSTSNILDSIIEGGFVIITKTVSVSTRNTLLQKCTEVSVIKSSDDVLSLLRKRPSNKGCPQNKVVQITNTPDDWVEQLQTSAADPALERLWLYGTTDTGVLGLCNALRQEDCGSKIRCVLSDVPLSDEELDRVMRQDLVVNVYREGRWGTYRHHDIPTVNAITMSSDNTEVLSYVDTLTRGDLSSLSWISAPLPSSSSSDSVTCKVEYASLNFRDVMIATGKLPPDALPLDLQGSNDCVLGLEFSGYRETTGSKVMGILPVKALATRVITKDSFLWNVPEGWSLEEAASVPVVYCTAYYSLLVRGRLRHGNSVLVHSGSGGVGQAAISIALSMGCKVFTTCGSQQKVDFLLDRFPGLQREHILNSRSAKFEQDIMTLTDSRGVDVVLNSLADDKLKASLRCVAKHGRFLEIGKYDLSEDNPIGLSVFLRNISFHGILLDALFEGDNDDWHEVRKLFDEGLKSGVVRPLPVTTFQNNELEQAFRFMAQGKHIGKVVISTTDNEGQLPNVVIPKFSCNSDSTYIVTGGLGGFGLELVQWLADKGATDVIVTSRSGLKSSYQKWVLRRLAARGTTVTVHKSDTTTEAGVRELLTSAHHPVKGVFHLAGVLRDGLLDNLEVVSFKEVYQPKVNTALHLDALSRDLCPELDTFVCFSSVVSGRGNSGQCNYAAANSTLERVCERRVEEGLPGLAVQWGAIGDVGMAYTMVGNNANIGGTFPQRIWNCLEILESSLNLSHPIMSSIVLADKGNSQSVSSDADLVTVIANILGAADPSKLDKNTTLEDMGLDSLMSVEVKQALDRAGFPLSNKEIRVLTLGKIDTLQNNSNTTPSIQAGSEVTTDHSSIIVELKRVTGTQPLYIVHPITLSIAPLANLAKHLNCTVFAVMYTEEADNESTIEQLSVLYLGQILRQMNVEGTRRIRLAGYSFGALLAFEIAGLLEKEERSEEGPLLEYLGMIDGSPNWVQYQINRGKDLARSNSDEIDKSTEAVLYYMKTYLGIEPTKEIYDELTPHSTNVKKQTEIAMKLIQKHHPSFKEVDDTRWKMHHSTNLLLRAESYKPTITVHQNVHLIRAKDGFKDTSEDYDIHKVCSGKVTVDKVDGTHETCVYEYSSQTAQLIQNQLDAL